MRRIILFALLFALLLGVMLNAHAQTVVLLDGPVKITAEARAVAKNDGNADTKLPARTASTTFDLSIADKAVAFQFSVAQHGAPADALAALRARIGWKDGFLFIRDDCLGANGGNRVLRCVVDQVFQFVDSVNGKRLVHLGEVFTGDDCAEEAKFGCALYQGVFTDVFDAFENNTMIGRVDVPAPLLEMRAVNGQLVVDLDETWGRNQERYTAGTRCLAAKQEERMAVCIDGISLRGAYFFNSILATYTKRGEALMRVRTYARTALCDGAGDRVGDGANDGVSEGHCSDLLRKSALVLAEIRPGEKPRSRTNVRSAATAQGK